MDKGVRACENCGGPYLSQIPHQKYCSEKCKVRAAWARQNALRKKRYHADPEFRAKEIARTAAIYKARMESDPEFREHRLQYFRDLHTSRRKEGGR